MTRVERSHRRSLCDLIPLPRTCPDALGAGHDGFVPGRFHELPRKRETGAAWTVGGAAEGPAARAEDRPNLADKKVFEATVRPYLPQIYRVCLALCRDADEAEDLLQNSLVKAYIHAESFEGRSDPFAWICGIVRNEHLETVRTRLRRFSLLDAVLEGCASVLGTLFTGGSEEPSPEEQAIHSEQWDTLLVCMRSLPEDHRMVVLLCDVEEFSYERVSEILEIPIGTVKSRHARGRARLREAFLKAERGTTAKEER
ncbi:RNA polymerase sigma factor [Sorangium sp. So ce1151]|uniref:RNA polymerase sigma factor n=1 Tax=Sorangium sp. So ce1151 TaxID=3133332 RepID=UPI003F60D3DE